ncbi:MAG: 3-methyl-2-oxobutanoate dehydrogenase subunit VorB [Dehalococcoidia bacterium]|nr:3-methyl-2-oxobutanoate dehydrogenase subunit VorB [Dehalococcoidia bacterium]
MPQRVFIDGNEAIARGAIQAGCCHFFGYPITPQSEIAEFMSRELPQIGGTYVQSECEGASVYMVYGGALAGARVMTSTSSPGFSLMQEGISYMAEMETPAVVVDVMRMGPGIGTGGQHGQTDYRQLTKGGGHGAYRCIVLAPDSPQECFDHMQLAFHLADKYRGPLLVASDFIIGRMAEQVELRTLEFEPLPAKEWALSGKAQRGGKRSFFISSPFTYAGPHNYYIKMKDKYRHMEEAEVRWEEYHADDARLLIVSYGSSARLARGAVDQARQVGLPVGLLRPITLWPFPQATLRDLGWKANKVLVVEDSPGEMVEDVEAALQGKVPVHFLGMEARYIPKSRGLVPGGSGLIMPERILEEIKTLL